jgi:hypothetical protein
MEIAVLAALSALVVKVTDFLRYVAAAARGEKGHGSAIVTQLTAWLGGVIAVGVAARSGITQGVSVPGLDVTIGKLDGWSQVLAGLMVGSAGSLAIDAKQAVDGTDTATKPTMLKG